MRRQVGHIQIETIAAELSKFTAPIVLVHGLWCTSPVWHRLMGYLAHRGWDCHAVNLRGRTPTSKAQSPKPTTNVGLQDHLDDLNAVIAACDSPPVLLGHDLGGLLAISRSLGPLRAVVALAPLIPASQRSGVIPGVSDLRARVAMKLRGRLPPPRGRARQMYFGSTPPAPLVAESASVGRQLGDSTFSFPLGTGVPTLIVAGSADGVTPIAAISKLANTITAELQQVSGAGHAIPWETGWQERVTEIHRWLIRTLGDSLLALLDEEEAG